MTMKKLKIGNRSFDIDVDKIDGMQLNSHMRERLLAKLEKDNADGEDSADSGGQADGAVGTTG